MAYAIRLHAEVRHPASGTTVVGGAEWTHENPPTLRAFCRAADDLYEWSPTGQGPLYFVVEIEGIHGSVWLSTRTEVQDPGLASLGLWFRLFGKMRLERLFPSPAGHLRREQAGRAAFGADPTLR